MKKQKRTKYISILVFICLLGTGSILLYPYYTLFQAGEEKNVVCSSEQIKIFIPEKIQFKNLGAYMKDKGWIRNESSFKKVVLHKNKGNDWMLPGIQLIKKEWNNKKLVNQLYLARNNGEVEITFNHVRLKSDLSERLCAFVSASKEEFEEILYDNEVCNKYGFTQETIMTMFLPDTYQVKYNTSAQELIDRMALEYKKFWTESNLAKARAIGLSQSEISTLASIVQAEQSRKIDEQPIIAGLYLNRLKKGMRLESDPTLIFAHGDFTITWVKNEHKNIDSPYNTYKHLGLPPGPINLPEKSAIKSVLNPANHDYIFMCAKPETGGYHNFAKTYNQHLVFARQFQKWNRAFHKKNNNN